MTLTAKRCADRDAVTIGQPLDFAITGEDGRRWYTQGRVAAVDDDTVTVRDDYHMVNIVLTPEHADAIAQHMATGDDSYYLVS